MELGGKHVLRTVGRWLWVVLVVAAGPAWGQNSYRVSDGPFWPTSPPTYNCLEACALHFGGTPAHWACSTTSSSINHLAFVDGYADPQYCQNPVSETFKVGTSFNTYGTYSAFVFDHYPQCAVYNYCFSTTCGNGVLDLGEQCDDGNQVNGDCCGSTCLAEPAGNACADDHNPCTADVCDATGHCTHPLQATCDHFTCYKERLASGSPPFAPASATLVDQFGSLAVAVVKPKTFCAPTNKMGEDPAAPSRPDHLTSYQIKPAVKAVLPPNQVIVNQFGTITVDPKKPSLLMVPSAKSLVASPSAPSNPAIDHFECYKVRRSKDSPKFAVIPGATIQDQFGSMTVDVRKPKELCTPVDKNGETPGAEDHPVHLMCYQVKQTSTPKFTPITPIYINNQFGPLTLTASKPFELCVPSSKNPTCGNGVVDPGEQCEPAAGPCCDATCHFKASGAACSPDTNPCTDDVCSGTSVLCTHPNNIASCNDGIFCNGTDTCSGGVCQHSGDPCTGGAECDDVCNEGTDSCFTPSGTPCTADTNVCTDDVCDGAGTCGHPNNSAPCADDGNVCTDDVCNGGMCTHPSNSAPCNDGIFCNGIDVCSGGVCTHPGDPCTGGAECANVCDEANDTCNVPAGTPCTPAGDPCINDVCNGYGQCGVNVCMFTLSGVLTNVPVSSLTGWTQCYTDTYGNSGTALVDILTSCNQGQLLLACRPTGSSTLQVLANAPRTDVIFDTGSSNTPHDGNGVGWYYNDNWSWGFAPQGDVINRSSCDIVASSFDGYSGPDPTERLCWHTGGNFINSGWRCGANDRLFSSAFERLIFQAP
jgi:cysteine-rich repeat protein